MTFKAYLIITVFLQQFRKPIQGGNIFVNLFRAYIRTVQEVGGKRFEVDTGDADFQLVSIPFALRAARGRFIGIIDGIASLLPLLIVVVVVFGKPQLLNTRDRWEAAFILMLVTLTDLCGGYAFNIALSRRMVDIGGTA